MDRAALESTVAVFETRLATLEHLLEKAEVHFGDDAFLRERIIADMAPLGTQVAYTCNQPRNFALWCAGSPMDNLDPEVEGLDRARAVIAETRQGLAAIDVSAPGFSASTRLDFAGGAYVELTSSQYVGDFLMPNFYFHLVTAYDILRKLGVDIGKADYMRHLAPLVKIA